MKPKYVEITFTDNKKRRVYFDDWSDEKVNRLCSLLLDLNPDVSILQIGPLFLMINTIKSFEFI